MTPEPLPAQGFSSSPDEASGAGADVADLLREAARGVAKVCEFWSSEVNPPRG